MPHKRAHPEGKSDPKTMLHCSAISWRKISIYEALGGPVLLEQPPPRILLESTTLNSGLFVLPEDPGLVACLSKPEGYLFCGPFALHPHIHMGVNLCIFLRAC